MLWGCRGQGCGGEGGESDVGKDGEVGLGVVGCGCCVWGFVVLDCVDPFEFEAVLHFAHSR